MGWAEALGVAGVHSEVLPVRPISRMVRISTTEALGPLTKGREEVRKEMSEPIASQVLAYRHKARRRLR